MGKYDITERQLEEYNEVLADICNVLLFGGDEVIDENDLQDVPGQKSQFKADDGTLHEQERDLSKFWTKDNVILSLIGTENQTRPDPDMPLRTISYDGASYKSQILSDPDGKSRYPVVTLVLYFGQVPWNTSKSLFERLVIPDKLKPFVNDHRINLFEISFLSIETVRKFKSDFRIVAEWCVRSRTEPDYRPDEFTIHHVDEVLKLLAVISNEDWYNEARKIFKEETKGEVTMGTFFAERDRLIEKKKVDEIIMGLLRQNVEASVIALSTNVPVEYVEQIKEKLLQPV